jgi:multiple antibiotic resistance protein
MGHELSLFVGTFATLLAIINPLEVLPVYLKMLEGKGAATHRQVAWKACLYALLLSLFFLIFGTLILRLFGVPLSMVRIVGGIILMKIGFELFSPSTSGGVIPAGGADQGANIAFVPLAMPLMCGPGAIATSLGMTATIKQSSAESASFVAIVAAIFATMARSADVFKTSSWRKVEEAPKRQFKIANKSLILLALPRGIEPLFQP